MLKNFLTDQLTLAVTIGCKPNSFGSAQRLADGLELSGLVATLCRARSVKTFRPKKYRRPPLPRRNNVLRFKKIEQMALSWKNIAVARTNCGADVFGLAAFLRDDDLICHDDPLGWSYSTAQLTREHIENIVGQSGQAVGVRPWLKSPITSRCRSSPMTALPLASLWKPPQNGFYTLRFLEEASYAIWIAPDFLACPAGHSAVASW